MNRSFLTDFFLLPALIAMLLFEQTTQTTMATTIIVTSTADSGAGTLRDTLATAAHGDTIDMSGVSGTILLTSGELLVTNSVTILGPGPVKLAVDGNAASRVFHLSGTVVTIVGLTITNGRADAGGGIYTGPGALTVSNCTLSGNSATNGRGGGIYNYGNAGSATLTVSASTLSSNSASINGGGIYNDGKYSGNGIVTVSNSTFSGNSASYGSGIYNGGYNGSAPLTVSRSTFSGNSASASGGAIYNDGNSGSAPLTVSTSTLSGNWASFGGGIYNDGNSGSAPLTVSGSTLSGNSASASGGAIYNNSESSGTGSVQIATSILSGNSANGGGGIYNDGTSSGMATLTVSTSTLSGNWAIYEGGGIYNDGRSGSATVTVSVSTLSGNSASYDGGGIYNDGRSGSATLTVSASTLSGNSASYAVGGIYNDGRSGSATLTVSASTLSGNSANYIVGSIYNVGYLEIGSTILDSGGGNIANLGFVRSDGYNLASDGGAGVLTSTADQINTSPVLGPLQDNGGPTFTHALLPGSPAIDKGANLGGYLTDQRGFPRTLDRSCIANAPGGDGTDIGAFEVHQPCPVPLPIVNVGVVSNQFVFDLAGSSDQVVVVEASTDLVSWTALANNTLGASTLHFSDPGSTNLHQRFYRTKLVQ